MKNTKNEFKKKYKIKQDDNVIVIAGKEIGKQGKVSAINRKTDRVIVEGVNQIRKGMKKQQENDKGGFIDKEVPIHISNLMITDPSTGNPTRVGYKTMEDGRKVRYAKKSGEIIDK